MPAAAARSLSLAEQHDWYRQASSSLRSSGGAAKRASARPPGALVVPIGRHLAYGADPRREMALAWQVPAAVARPFVRIGTAPNDLGERIGADIRVSRPPAEGAAIEMALPARASSRLDRYYLQVSLSGLSPGTAYHYVVGHAGRDGAEMIDTARTFITAPAGRDRFVFTAFGDQGVTTEATATAGLVAAQRPAFHLHAGDLSYAESGGQGLVTDSFDATMWDSFLTQIEPVASRVPWQIATGNHEMEAWYSPDGYGGMHDRFVLPDANAPPTTRSVTATWRSSAWTPTTSPMSSRPTWVFRRRPDGVAPTELASYRADPDIDFIVAYFHHCAYCTCSSHSSEGGVRAEWTPLFDIHAVDLVINGHNHIYERTDPIRAGAATTSAPTGATVTPASHGTTYITAGGAGADLYAFSAPDTFNGEEGSDGGENGDRAVTAFVSEAGAVKRAETVEWSRVRYTGHSLLVIESAPAEAGGTSTLTVRTLAWTGAEIDNVVLARPVGLHRDLRPYRQ